MDKATAVAHSNIAFIKYWGHAQPALRVPANPSISMNLDCLNTVTTVVFTERLAADEVTVNQAPADYVLGQADFTGDAPDRGGAQGAETMSGPHGLYATAEQLYVADTGNNRILIFDLDVLGRYIAL